MELLGGRVYICLQETDRPFSKVIVPFYIPANIVWEF